MMPLLGSDSDGDQRNIHGFNPAVYNICGRTRSNPLNWHLGSGGVT